jgi:hypothetical protein
MHLIGLEDRPRRQARSSRALVQDIDARERPRLRGPVAEVQRQQRLAPVGPAPEIYEIRDARERSPEIEGEALPIDWVVEDCIDVAEDSIFANRAFRLQSMRLVVRTELLHCPIGDVVDSLLSDEPVAWHLLVGVDGRSKM